MLMTSNPTLFANRRFLRCKKTAVKILLPKIPRELRRASNRGKQEPCLAIQVPFRFTGPFLKIGRKMKNDIEALHRQPPAFGTCAVFRGLHKCSPLDPVEPCRIGKRFGAAR